MAGGLLPCGREHQGSESADRASKRGHSRASKRSPLLGGQNPKAKMPFVHLKFSGINWSHGAFGTTGFLLHVLRAMSKLSCLNRGWIWLGVFFAFLVSLSVLGGRTFFGVFR